ncbi:hypothetical protein OG413_14100 [Streptomyces sp. NBC_01433]|uniref:hypothetical protein n=1 Tax=Streptomyces sp. NBC_01433 TaxID=2903864 RepID=UPI002251FDF1|nr:hypothetical protein [Streptomyces sp. NBC_01433]MCX4676423.1 hypothetical protein [Streptomyces sp. NBC_01433]
MARLIRTGTKRALKAARALREICEESAPTEMELGAIDARTARRPIGALRF